jgi:RNA polymerase sigma-70 factor, ECF subfamily
MSSTPVSLLERLRQPASDSAWTQFVHLYAPILASWTRRIGLTQADAEDLIQEVFTILVKKLPEFVYDPSKGFRKWLFTITRHKWLEHERKKHPVSAGAGVLEEVPAPEEDDIWDREYRQQLLLSGLEMIRPAFDARTWKAFEEHGLENRAAAEVGQELGMKEGAVRAARFRVMKRLRTELEGMLD